MTLAAYFCIFIFGVGVNLSEKAMGLFLAISLSFCYPVNVVGLSYTKSQYDGSISFTGSSCSLSGRSASALRLVRQSEVMNVIKLTHCSITPTVELLAALGRSYSSASRVSSVEGFCLEVNQSER